jgi:acid stress chaperone HdeB
MTVRQTPITSAFLAAGIIIGVYFASNAHAQVQIDVSKITCDQFVHGKISNPRTMAAWLSGYYHGKRNDPIVDPQSFEANFNKLENFCYNEKNFKLSVMQAIQRTIALPK